MKIPRTGALVSRNCISWFWNIGIPLDAASDTVDSWSSAASPSTDYHRTGKYARSKKKLIIKLHII